MWSNLPMTAFLLPAKLISFLANTTNLWAEQPRRATKSVETVSSFGFYALDRVFFEDLQGNVLHGANKKWAAL